MLDWIQEHDTLLWWVFVASVVMCIAGAIGMRWLVIHMPRDWFLRHGRKPDVEHPALRILLLVARNILGWLLLLAGIAMLFAPGQGVLTILLALTLIDFPGKRRLELAIVRRRPIRRTIDKVRAKHGRPPILLPGEPDEPQESAGERA